MVKFLGVGIASALLSVAFASEGPNIVWIIADDMGVNMGCYGDTYARTPNLDTFASQGTRFTHAFSVHGQCSPSRSALITGMYPTTIGTQHMRCEGIPPASVKCFTEYLRQSGYFCTNNAKTDYNFGWNGSKSPADWTTKAPLGAWDECDPKAHWRNRPNNKTPFFSVFTLGTTHESQIFAADERAKNLTRELSTNQLHDPAAAPLPPYYPDHPQVRHDVARYYDLVTAMDIQAGRLLQQLEEDELADDTVVFFFADNGRGLPRAKRWLYDWGIHVPLIVRWPGTVAAGAVQDRLVSFVDFAPTVLSISGVSIPSNIQGRPFLGRGDGAPLEYIFAARDRYDEVVDYTRAVRDHRYKYIRNFRPEIPYAVEVAYM
ncbi:MAG: sulfatase, partial [Candidatus Hydrogenedentota bacterium]